MSFINAFVLAFNHSRPSPTPVRLNWSGNWGLQGSVCVFNAVNQCRGFYTPNLRSEKRIGPHSYEFLQIAIGLILGDASLIRLRINDSHNKYCESMGKIDELKPSFSYRITMGQGELHAPYIFSVCEYLNDHGYGNQVVPSFCMQENKLETKVATSPDFFESFRLHTYKFSSFGWLFDLLYDDLTVGDNYHAVKTIKPDLIDHLTPLAVAHWIACDGVRHRTGLKFATNSFSEAECMLLAAILNLNHGLHCTVQEARGEHEEYNVYVLEESMPRLRKLILPHLHPSMHYKVLADKTLPAPGKTSKNKTSKNKASKDMD